MKNKESTEKNIISSHRNMCKDIKKLLNLFGTETSYKSAPGVVPTSRRKWDQDDVLCFVWTI